MLRGTQHVNNFSLVFGLDSMLVSTRVRPFHRSSQLAVVWEGLWQLLLSPRPATQLARKRSRIYGVRSGCVGGWFECIVSYFHCYGGTVESTHGVEVCDLYSKSRRSAIIDCAYHSGDAGPFNRAVEERVAHREACELSSLRTFWSHYVCTFVASDFRVVQG